MTGRYRISEKAIADLEEIWFYTYNKWAIKQADRYHNLIIGEIEYISDNFELSRKMDYIRPGYRMSKVKSHLIFYKILEDDTILIIRILHQSMEIENRLKDDE